LLWLAPIEIQEDAGQPRQEFPPEDQTALAESIAESGVKVPLLVRSMPDGTYQLTDGARRLRAARTAGLDLVSCVVSQAGGWLMVRHDQLLANAQRLDLTPLEDAQALYILWLGRQIQALEAEQDDAGATTAQFIAESDTPTQQIATLEARLCTLDDVPTVAVYLGGGPMQVRVTWQTVLQSIGRGAWTPDRRKKHLAVLQLAPSVQDALAGLPMSARTLREVAHLPPDAQQVLVAQVMGDDVLHAGP
jgi:ParB/RepB/Spo0J family partition protein